MTSATATMALLGAIVLTVFGGCARPAERQQGMRPAGWRHSEGSAEWRLSTGPDWEASVSAATGCAFIGGELREGNTWAVYRVSEGHAPDEVYQQRGRWLGLAASPDGSQLLVWFWDESDAESVLWLDVKSAKPRVVGRFRGEGITGSSWASPGESWLGLKSTGLGASSSALVLHRDPDHAARLPLRAAEVGDASIAGYWPAADQDAAYLLLDDGRIYRATTDGLSLLSHLPVGEGRKLQWHRYSRAGDVLFMLPGDSTLARTDLRTGQTERTSLQRQFQSLKLPAGYLPRLDAVSENELVLTVEPPPTDDELGEDGPRGDAGGLVRYYVLRYPEGTLHPLLRLPPQSASARSATSHGVAVAKDGAVWILWYDFDHGELVLNRLSPDK